LNIYPAILLLLLFANQTPATSFYIGLDVEVIRNYSEFEQYLLNFQRQTPEMQQSLRWNGATMQADADRRSRPENPIACSDSRVGTFRFADFLRVNLN